LACTKPKDLLFLKRLSTILSCQDDKKVEKHLEALLP